MNKKTTAKSREKKRTELDLIQMVISILLGILILFTIYSILPLEEKIRIFTFVGGCLLLIGFIGVTLNYFHLKWLKENE